MVIFSAQAGGGDFLCPELAYTHQHHRLSRGSSNDEQALTMEKSTQPWRKLLYTPQPYPDNYTDVSFLSQLKRNSTVKRYTFRKLISDFSLVSLHLNTLALTHIFFLGLYSYDTRIDVPLTVSTTISVLLLLFYNSSDNSSRVVIQDALKSSLVISFTIFTLSPVLKSLSESTSSDSIWSLSFGLVVANLITTDYHFNLKDKFNPIVSTNVLIAEATVLASRFNSDAKVFAFMLFCIQIHGIFPIFDTWLREFHVPIHHLMTLATGSIATFCIYKMMEFPWLLIWCILHSTILVFCPIYFILLQKYKNELQGPWDIAKPILNGTD